MPARLSGVSRPDVAALELLRASSGLSIDSEGRFLHRGEPITHPRTLEVLWRSLEAAPGGRWLVRVGRESAYVAVDETPWVVKGVLDEDGDAPVLLLTDGSREPLDPDAVSLAADGVLRCRMKSGRRARFSRAGQLALGRLVDEDPPGSGRYALTIRGTRRWLRDEAGG